jgi:hypothetical protein
MELDIVKSKLSVNLHALSEISQLKPFRRIMLPSGIFPILSQINKVISVLNGT